MKISICAENVHRFCDTRECDISIEFPKQCPHCGTAYCLPPTSTVFSEFETDCKMAYSIFFCPVCNECFFLCYDVINDGEQNIGLISNLFPCAQTKTNFSSGINEISPNFINIYNQAEQAENQGLKDICGMGYRKALEFLIKDYAIHVNPEKSSEIESSSLGNCISAYIDDEKIQQLARASSWIGNDETHYIKKHPSYVVDDLKRFIKTTVSLIDYNLDYQKAFDFVSNSR